MECRTPLPPAWSLLLFPPSWTKTSELGADGCEPSPLHLSSLSSDVVLERMWVSGSFAFPPPASPQSSLLVGETVHCVARVSDIRERTGKDGRKGWYVDTERVMRGEKSGAEVVETRTHLYRYPLGKNAASSSPSTKPSANAGTLSEKKQSDWAVGWTSDPKHLFRYAPFAGRAPCRDVDIAWKLLESYLQHASHSLGPRLLCQCGKARRCETILSRSDGS